MERKALNKASCTAFACEVHNLPFGMYVNDHLGLAVYFHKIMASVIINEQM